MSLQRLENLHQVYIQPLNKMKRSLVVRDFTELSLRIYTIGYPQVGECLLCVLFGAKIPLFTFVVDSYSLSGQGLHALCDILDTIKVRVIDVLVWTHPHDDHSVGIEDLLDRYDPQRKAKIFISDGIAQNKESIGQNARAAYEYLVSHYNRGQRYNLNGISVTSGEVRNITAVDIKEGRSGNILTCDFQFVAPLNPRVIRQEFNINVDPNAMSIMFALSLNRINYLFCGDTEDTTLNQINYEVLKNARFVKIPHHGSNNCVRLIDYLEDSMIKDVVAVTTVFTPKELPRQEVLKKYEKSCAAIYSTESGDEKYGCVQIDFDVTQGDILGVDLYGNAIQVYPAD